MSENPTNAPDAVKAEVAPENARIDSAPIKRRFAAYRLERSPETGDFCFIEEYEEWDRTGGEYRLKRMKANLPIPASARRRLLSEDAGFRQSILEFVNSMRRELDGRGVKIYLDISKDGGETAPVRAKWTYFLLGRRVDESVDWSSLPEVREMVRPCELAKDLWPLVEAGNGMPEPDVFSALGYPAHGLDSVRERFQAVRGHFRKYGTCRYYETRDWKVWFGKAMQQKRERILASELQRLCDEQPSSVPFGEESEGISGLPASAIGGATRERALSDASAMIENLFSSLKVPMRYEPSDVATDLHIMNFSRSLLDLVFRKYGGRGSSGLSDSEIASLVSGVMARKAAMPSAAVSGPGDGADRHGHPVMTLPADRHDGSLREHFRRLAIHALSTDMNKSAVCLDTALIERICHRLESLCSGVGDRQMSDKFRSGIAAYDHEKGELRVHHVSRLGQFIKRLYFGVATEGAKSAAVESPAIVGERR